MSQKKADTAPHESNYARKRKYCARHGVWGWEVPEPKPWKRKRRVGVKAAA